MDTSQEELVAALVRRLQGRAPRRSADTRRSGDTLEVGSDLDVLIELDSSDEELLDR